MPEGLECPACMSEERETCAWGDPRNSFGDGQIGFGSLRKAQQAEMGLMGANGPDGPRANGRKWAQWVQSKGTKIERGNLLSDTYCNEKNRFCTCTTNVTFTRSYQMLITLAHCGISIHY